MQRMLQFSSHAKDRIFAERHKIPEGTMALHYCTVLAIVICAMLRYVRERLVSVTQKVEKRHSCKLGIYHSTQLKPFLWTVSAFLSLQ